VRVIEVGTGHGLMATRLLRDVPGSRYLGLDLSPFSLRYASSLLHAHGIADDRVDLRLVPPDGVVDLSSERGQFDVGLCCEVLEHVKDPRVLLDLLRESLRPGGRAFVTTVANMEAVDHVYLYDDADHIRRELTAAGFTVERELVQTVRGMENVRPQPLNYAAIIAKGDRPA
jgi:2-polyprenyl-3-methyl-5-hydroxy-6-metoxy-1,4-benzoquinol methylase